MRGQILRVNGMLYDHWPWRGPGDTRLILAFMGAGITHTSALTTFCNLHNVCVRVCFCVCQCRWPCMHVYSLITLHTKHVPCTEITLQKLFTEGIIYPDFTSVHLLCLSTASCLFFSFGFAFLIIKSNKMSRLCCCSYHPTRLCCDGDAVAFLLCHHYHSGSCCVQ